MALTIRKRTKSGLIVPKSYSGVLGNYPSNEHDDHLEAIVNETIKSILHEKLGVSATAHIKRMLYFPVYGYFKKSSDKTINSMYLKIQTKNIKFVKIPTEEIEIAGVTLVEFLDYINTRGATEIQESKVSFDIV